MQLKEYISKLPKVILIHMNKNFTVVQLQKEKLNVYGRNNFTWVATWIFIINYNLLRISWFMFKKCRWLSLSQSHMR